jgi:hypothetical protein
MEGIKKVMRDGQVGVLISHGWGSGFYTWGVPLQAIFDEKLIYLIENKKFDEAVEYVAETYANVYTGGVHDLEVHWIDEGVEFFIDEYDGNESIVFKEEVNWITA